MKPTSSTSGGGTLAGSNAGPVVAAACRVSCASPFQHGGRPESNAKSIAPKA